MKYWQYHDPNNMITDTELVMMHWVWWHDSMKACPWTDNLDITFDLFEHEMIVLLWLLPIDD